MIDDDTPENRRAQWVARLKGGPITMLLFLCILKRSVHEKEMVRRLIWDKATVRKHLRVLESEGLAVHVDEFWQLPSAGRQLALHIILDAPEEGVGEIAPASDAQGSVIVRKQREILSPSISIGFRESDSINDSVKTNNTRARKFLAGPGEGHDPNSAPQHISNIQNALRLKGAPAPVTDDPFPPDLRQCVEMLVRETGAPRRKAELAVARSPWDSPKIMAQIMAWKRYRKTPAAAGIRPSGFPFLVMARIAAGEELDERLNDQETCSSCGIADGSHAANCPHKYDGFLTVIGHT